MTGAAGGPGQLLLALMLAVAIFAVSLDLKPAAFAMLLRAPRALLAGLGAQVVLLPAGTWLFTMAVPLDPAVALGLLIVGACPGGATSNFVTFKAGGNVALSLSVSGLSGLLAPLTTPLNVLLWAGLNPQTAPLLRQFAIEPVSFFASLFVTLGLPLIAALLLRHWRPALADRLQPPATKLTMLIVAGIVGTALWQLAGQLGVLAAAVLPAAIGHNALALLLGYGTARIAGLERLDRRAVTIEVGMQNATLGLIIIMQFFDGLPGAALTAAAWGIWHLVSGLTLALLWRRLSPA